MKFLLAGLLLIAACSPRTVEVQTGSETSAEVSLAVNNQLDQAVSVFVVTPSQEIFLKEVAAKSNETLPVRGVASGTTVRLRATATNGKTYTKDNVQLQMGYVWQLP
jgi:hypothetical protein